jgi:hypothetical protein
MRALKPFTTKTASELDILALNSDALGVDSAHVGILIHGDEVFFSGLLQSFDG